MSSHSAAAVDSGRSSDSCLLAARVSTTLRLTGQLAVPATPA